MAKVVVTHVTDDIDGSPNASPVVFGFQGVAYSIDLAAKNLEKLTKALEPFIEHSARHGKPRLGNMRKDTPSSARTYDIGDLRAWAAKNDITVPKRGRIPASVVEQYTAQRGR